MKNHLVKLRNDYSLRGLPGNLIDSLLKGLSKPELEGLLFRDGMSPNELETLRMNLIGDLRGRGFVVTGGRGGGSVYRIVDWKEPEVRPGIESWDEESRSKLESLSKDYLEITPDHWDDIQRKRLNCSTNRTWLHEVSALKIFAYDLANNVGKFLTSGTGDSAILIQKNRNRPVFSILNLNASYHHLARWAQMVAPISIRSVKIIDVDKEDLLPLKDLFPSGSSYTMEEAIYETARITRMDPWGKGSQSEIRRRGKTLDVEEVRGAETAQEWVVDVWKHYNEKRQRQLSIVRDYRSIDLSPDSKRTFLGFRGNVPVAFQNFDQINPRFVAMITEKAFNRGEMPRGTPWTTDGMIWKVFSRLHEEGVLWVQGGLITGGTQGLADHKRKLSIETLICHSFDTGLGRENVTM